MTTNTVAHMNYIKAADDGSDSGLKTRKFMQDNNPWFHSFLLLVNRQTPSFSRHVLEGHIGGMSISAAMGRYTPEVLSLFEFLTPSF